MESDNLGTDEVVARRDAVGDRERKVAAVVVENLCEPVTPPSELVTRELGADAPVPQ